MKIKLIFSTILAIFLLVGCQTQTVNQSVNSVVNEPLMATGREELQDESDESVATTTPEEQNEEAGLPAGASVQAEEVLGVEIDEAEVVEEPEISQTIDYPVAFVSQAPYAVWDDLHKEACEEAVIITVVKYFKNESLTAHTMEQGILGLVKWEEENGYKIDLTAAEVTEILNNFFELNAELVTEVTIDRIKEELSAGKLIIIPAAGRQLMNPYFQTPGPIYHMLVIRGYTQTEFITNDVGTKRGDGFKYEYQQLIDAIHDWDHSLTEGGMTDEEIEQGRKVMIVVGK